MRDLHDVRLKLIVILFHQHSTLCFFYVSGKKNTDFSIGGWFIDDLENQRIVVDVSTMGVRKLLAVIKDAKSKVWRPDKVMEALFWTTSDDAFF